MAGWDHPRVDGYLGDLRPGRAACPAERGRRGGSVSSGRAGEPGDHRVPAGLAWARRGRRGRKTDPEWAQRNRLLRAAESLTEEESAKLHDAMRDADPTGGLERCWQGKEMLRRLLALAGTDPDRNLIWNRLSGYPTHLLNQTVQAP